VTCAGPAGLPTGDAARTVEMWIKMNHVDNQYLASRGNATANQVVSCRLGTFVGSRSLRPAASRGGPCSRSAAI